MTPSIAWDRVAPRSDLSAQATGDIPFCVQEATMLPGDVFEGMAETGRLSLPLVKAEVQLTCVEHALEMRTILRQKLAREHLSAQVHEMDGRDLACDPSCDLMVIPFHACGALISSADQKRVLARLHEQRSDKGHFLCPLHYPSQRLHSVDGQIHFTGSDPGGDSHTPLCFWSVSTSASTTTIVHVWQCFEQDNQQGIVPLAFR